MLKFAYLERYWTCRTSAYLNVVDSLTHKTITTFYYNPSNEKFIAPMMADVYATMESLGLTEIGLVSESDLL